MKQYISKLMFVVLLCLAASSSVQAQYGFGTSNPNPSAVMDMTSTTKGFLPPRMTSAQIAAIKSPAEGLMVYNTDQQCMMVYSNSAFKCGFAGAADNQWTVEVNDAAPKFTSLDNQIDFPYVGKTATVSSVYLDTDATPDAPGTPIYQWYSYTDAAGGGKTAIPGAISSTYTFTEADRGKYIRVGVKATALTGTSPGVEQFASTYLPVWKCGMDLPLKHTIGAVAPETKSITYKTVLTTFAGTNQCWITQNLGASSNLATSINTATPESVGWYWQFDRIQGYKAQTNYNIIPGTFVTTDYSVSATITTNDPCLSLLGGSWRLPTRVKEWDKFVATLSTTDYNAAFSSPLALTNTGFVLFLLGKLQQTDIIGMGIYMSANRWLTNTSCVLITRHDAPASSTATDDKSINVTIGMSVRCVTDNP